MFTTSRFSAVVCHPGFERDLKRLRKRFPTLESDISTLINYELAQFHKEGMETGSILRIAGLGFDGPDVYVAKRIACRALKHKGSNTGLRLTYAWFPDAGRIELIELYYKPDQPIEDKARIRRLYAGR